MFTNCNILKKNNITVVSPKTHITKIHRFEFDEVFHKDLTSSKKKICVFRNFRKDFLPHLEEFCDSFDIVFLEQEHWQYFSMQIDPTKFIFITDNHRESVLNFSKRSKNVLEYIPFHWFRTTFNYSKVNKNIWSKPKKFYLTARMNIPRPWKVELMSKLWDNENLTWSALQAHPQVPGSPKIFESEKSGGNPEMPSIEQALSWSLLCLNAIESNIDEKTFQHLYHLSPTIWHTSKIILDLEQFGFTVRFNGFDYSYLEMPYEQITDKLVKQIESMTPEDYKDFYHQNIKETENNHKIMKDINNWYRFFSPKIQQYL